MATQSPNNNITIKVSNIQAATSVNADGGSTWKQIESASTTLLVHNKLYIKYANIGGTYKNNVSKVTDDSGHELVKTPDNSNQYTVVTIPDGTTVVNIEYALIIEHENIFTLVFSVKNLSIDKISSTDKVDFDIHYYSETAQNNLGNLVTHVNINCINGGSIKIDNTSNPKFIIANVKSTSAFVVSFIDGLNYQHNSTTNTFSFNSGSTQYIDIYVDVPVKSGGSILKLVNPTITNFNNEFNPKITGYYNDGTFNFTSCLYENFIKKEYPSLSPVILNGPSYNSTFTNTYYVDFPITFKYDTPFRIENNNNVINSELVTGTTTTYQVTFNLTRNSKLPYYASNQEYRVNTNPYKRYFTVSNKNNYNARLQFSYTNKTNNTTKYSPDFANGENIKFCLTDIFAKEQQLVINNIWAYGIGSNNENVVDDSYFCPYVKINNKIYMCYDGFIGENDKVILSGAGTPLPIETTLLKYDIIKPNLISPTLNGEKIIFSYTYIYDGEYPKPIIPGIEKYQYVVQTSNPIYLNGDETNHIFKSWSNYGYNVKNSDYKLVFVINNPDKINYADDFDVVLDNKKLTYLSTGAGKTFTIKPNSNTNKYFSGSTDIYVYPKTSIKYVNNLHDDEGLNVNIRLNYSIDGVNKTSLINGGNTVETERFTYYNNAKHELIIDNISTVNPIDYIQVNWPGGSRKINGINDSSILLVNDYLKQPITWNSPSITYTFTVVTKQPSTQPQQRYAYGIEIDGNGLPKDVGSLSIALISDGYEIKSYSEGNLNSFYDLLTLDSTQVHNTQTIYVDKNDCTEVSEMPNIKLYNKNANYYIVETSKLPSNYIETSDSTCLYKGTIKLSNNISNNIAHAYKSQINFKPIGIKYNAYLNILNKDNTVVEKISTGTVSATQDTIISIPDDYVGDTYNVAISNIIGISNTGSEFPIERYNLNLVNLSGESTSYNIYKPIKVNNYSNANIILTDFAVPRGNDIWETIYNNNINIPSALIDVYIYRSSYIAPRKFTAYSHANISLEYWGTQTTTDVQWSDTPNPTTGLYYGLVSGAYLPLKYINIR